MFCELSNLNTMTSPKAIFKDFHFWNTYFKEYFLMIDQVQSNHQKHCIKTIFFIYQMSDLSYLILKESAEIDHNLLTLSGNKY